MLARQPPAPSVIGLMPLEVRIAGNVERSRITRSPVDQYQLHHRWQEVNCHLERPSGGFKEGFRALLST